MILLLCVGCGESSNMTDENSEDKEKETLKQNNHNTIPEELEFIPDKYYENTDQQGSLEKLVYQTWDSLTYDEHKTRLIKEAWVYVPYNYSQEKKYNVFYLSHGGWSNETTYLGTDIRPTDLKRILDHLIEDERIEPIIVVCPTYNNLSPEDSGNRIALDLVENFHNELINDLIPAVEGKYSTYAQTTDLNGIKESRDHRAFGGFSMGSVNTWHTFEYCLDYFRYYIPMSGNLTGDGEYMADIVRNSNYDWNDFFIYAASGTADFAYSSFKYQINAMANVYDGTFRLADNEQDGNLSFREREGASHEYEASYEYIYNGLLFFYGIENDIEKEFEPYDLNTRVEAVIYDPIFEDFGRLLVPADGSYSGNTLGDFRLAYYSIVPERTVEIFNYFKQYAENGETIFFDIYTDEEKKQDPDKADTGLFFFKGSSKEKTAICNAGGAFAFVGAMQDSFPHALELSKMGYNAFALIYRPGWTTAMEDLGKAIEFLYDHADELDIDMDNYSLWGGSAGARMAATLGNDDYLRYYTDRNDIPQATAVIVQYTGHSEFNESDAPTFVCVGSRDEIANWQKVKARTNALSSLGIPTEFHVYEGLGHGFGLGEGTVAEGWINDAVNFWERLSK